MEGHNPLELGNRDQDLTLAVKEPVLPDRSPHQEPSPPPAPVDLGNAVQTPERGGLRLRLVEFRLVTLLGDLALMNFSLWLCYHNGGIDSHLYPSRLALWHASLSLIWFLSAEFWGAYTLARLMPRRSPYVVIKVALTAVLMYLLVPFVTPILPPKRSFLVTAFLVPTALLALWRSFQSRYFSAKGVRQRALLVGGGLYADFVVKEWGSLGKGFDESLPYDILGFVGDPQECPGQLRHLGSRGALLDICRQEQPDEIVLADSIGTVRDEFLRSLLRCHESGIPVVEASRLIEVMTGKIALSLTDANLGTILPLFRGSSHRLYLVIKRLVDLGVSAFGFAVTLLVAPFLAFFNLFLNPGPLMYHQERVGKGGKSFRLYKFRSMVPEAENQGAVFATPGDGRVTILGRLLRRTRLDEMPQFWNILKGDMSLVGPRPERPVFVEEFSREIPLYQARHSVRPGLTGWAQVEYRYGSGAEDALNKLQYDLFYIKYQALYFDYLIILRTVKVMISLLGR